MITHVLLAARCYWNPQSMVILAHRAKGTIRVTEGVQAGNHYGEWLWIFTCRRCDTPDGHNHSIL
jgi:hypothetical protein